MDARVLELIERPGESLATELKRWIDPDTHAGAQKIVRALLALRNHGGGYLVIGFDDLTCQPDEAHAPENVEEVFHVDKIQGLVGKYASESFEIAISFPERANRRYPVISVPAGVKTPVAVKADLWDGQTKLLAVDDVFVRSLNSSNVPSTTRAGWRDWARIVEVCFENREADVARFIRRHLVSMPNDMLLALQGAASPAPNIEQELVEFLDFSFARSLELLAERSLTRAGKGWLEMAFIIEGVVPSHSANGNFLNLLRSSNPNYTGWPIWMVSGGGIKSEDRPFVFEGAWEQLLYQVDTGWDHMEFMRFEPGGKFYHLRALEDDLGASQRAPSPGTALEFALTVLRPAEAIAVAMAFAHSLGCDVETTTLNFAFRWTGLKGRALSSWASPGRYLSARSAARQDAITTYAHIPLSTALDAIALPTATVVQPVFNLFDGFELPQQVIDDLVRRLTERRLNG